MGVEELDAEQKSLLSFAEESKKMKNKFVLRCDKYYYK